LNFLSSGSPKKQQVAQRRAVSMAGVDPTAEMQAHIHQHHTPTSIAPATDKAVDCEGDAVMTSARSNSDTQQHQHPAKKMFGMAGSAPASATNQNQQQGRKSGTTFGRLRVVTAPATCVQDLQVVWEKNVYIYKSTHTSTFSPVFKFGSCPHRAGMRRFSYSPIMK
jgi:hypothetical protein